MKTSEHNFIAELDRILGKLASDLGDIPPRTAHKYLKTIFLVIRQRAYFEESLKFIEILPVPVKAMFLDGWQIQEIAPRPFRNMDDFAETVVRSSNRAIANPLQARQLLRKVFTFFGQLTSQEQMKEGLSFLPNDFHALLMSDPSLKYQYSDTCIWLS
uniref:DUF2267 domain-containing protein n=1 Tax=Roseihalotalea indica TaxID=2867963 RepID=A0AA49GN70_9BACT|nr:DUF2267 domain-containing protein [Tunicatimonas sp. TK19036]